MLDRMTTSVRVALLYILLALGSCMVLVGFIYLQTSDNALAELRASVADEGEALSQLYSAGNPHAFRNGVTAAVSGDDPHIIVGVFDRQGRRLLGNIVSLPSAASEPGFFVTAVPLEGGQDIDAGIEARRLTDGGLLITGRTLDERLSLQRTLQRSLVLSVFMSLVLGLAGSVVLTRYVGRRIGHISDVVDTVGAGQLGRRVPDSGSGDAFDGLAKRINLMLDRIQGLMDELRLLTDSLAHDLRSPVSRLRVKIERALTLTDEQQRDTALGGVLQEADSLMRMLTTVLEIGRSEAMASQRQFEILDPAMLMAELLEMYGPLGEESGVELRLRCSENLPPITGHRQLLAQALSNLIDNALKYGAAGGLIEMLAHQRDGELVLAVVDKGCGIAPEDEAEARRRFGRLDRARSTEGAGLGLSLVDAVARLHGGRLQLSDSGPGLQAAIILPVPGRQ